MRFVDTTQPDTTDALKCFFFLVRGLPASQNKMKRAVKYRLPFVSTGWPQSETNPLWNGSRSLAACVLLHFGGDPAFFYYVTIACFRKYKLNGLCTKQASFTCFLSVRLIFPNSSFCTHRICIISILRCIIAGVRLAVDAARIHPKPLVLVNCLLVSSIRIIIFKIYTYEKRKMNTSSFGDVDDLCRR